MADHDRLRRHIQANVNALDELLRGGDSVSTEDTFTKITMRIERYKRATEAVKAVATAEEWIAIVNQYEDMFDMWVVTQKNFRKWQESTKAPAP